MNSRERIRRIFYHQETDRPALKLWGANPYTGLLHPRYGPVHSLANEVADIFYDYWGTPFDIMFGKNRARYETVEDRPVPGTDWVDRISTWHTPLGALSATERLSKKGEPSYVIQHFIRSTDDMIKVLSIPYEPIPFSSDEFFAMEGRIGERGATLYFLDHAAYALQRLAGPETMAFLSVDAPAPVLEAITLYSRRILAHTREALAAGVRLFAWVGPEVFIPPLFSPACFEEYVYRFDKLLCDEIHNGGGRVWVHCHGKVKNFVRRFIDMGVDVLNPLEPMTAQAGDIDLMETARQYGSRIALEGNIENQTLLTESEEAVRFEVERCVQALKTSGRGILCPSSGYMEFPDPEERYIRNLLIYLQYGIEKIKSP
jgi:hypothetical protein